MTNLCALVVDDEEDIRFVARRLLKMHPDVATVLEASSLEDALSTCLQGPPPDFILTDLNMPSGSGLELIERLQKRGFSGALVLMSGSQRPACGEITFLRKPFTYKDVASVIEMVLAQKP